MTEKQVQFLRKKYPDCIGRCKIVSKNGNDFILNFKSDDIIYQFDNLQKATKFMKDHTPILLNQRREKNKVEDAKVKKEIDEIKGILRSLPEHAKRKLFAEENFTEL